MVGQRHAERRDRIREALSAAGLSAPLLVTNLANVRYLTGFSGSNGILVLSEDGDLIGTDGRYQEQVEQESPDLPVVIDRATLSAVLDRITGSALLVESSLDVGRERLVRERDRKVMIAPPFVEDARSVKDDEELALLEAACRITSEAFEILAGEIHVGMSERGIARRLEQIFGERGAQDRAFASIVATGASSAVPHHRAGDGELRPGDLLVVDAGACVSGYHADMTRTFVVGQSPAPWQVDLHGAVREAQEQATVACMPGATGVAIDEAARSVLREAGLEECFVHGLGHGVGLEIHEAPGIGQRSTSTLRPGMAFTIEPGVYLRGMGGVRIEDTLVVGASGPRVLTMGSRDLRVVGT